MVLSNDPDRKMSLTGAIMRHTTLRMRNMGMGTPEDERHGNGHPRGTRINSGKERGGAYGSLGCTGTWHAVRFLVVWVRGPVCGSGDQSVWIRGPTCVGRGTKLCVDQGTCTCGSGDQSVCGSVDECVGKLNVPFGVSIEVP